MKNNTSDQTTSLISISEISGVNSEKDSSFNKTQKRFKLQRFLIFSLLSIFEILVCFHRSCPAVVTEELAKSYNVKESDLGIFSSMFFYPYSIGQLFAGLLSDIMDPSILIGCSTIIAAFGSVLCALASSLSIGCLGRFLVGLGCAFIYCPSSRIFMNWYPLTKYPILLGLFHAMAAVGTFLGQTPFILLANAISWQWCFYLISIITVVMSILNFGFIRGSPVSLGYPPVNIVEKDSYDMITIKQRTAKLFSNLKYVITTPSAWAVVACSFFVNGSLTNITGIWGGPFLKEVLQFSSLTASNTLMGFTVGILVGSLLIPISVEKLFRSKKIVILTANLFAASVCIPFIVCPDKLPYAVIFILFMFFAICTMGMLSVLYPFGTTYFSATIGATAIGLYNFTGNASLIVYMPFTGFILEHFERIQNNEIRHDANGFKYGLWLFDLCGLIVADIIFAFAKENSQDSDMIENDANNYQVFD